MRISTAAENSYEFLMYHFLQQRYAGDKRIEFNIGLGYHSFTKVYDTRIRWHHGDAIRYKDGVGGLTIPLHKALDRWNTATPADIDVLGHWHTYLNSKRFVVNGSVMGYNPYGIWIRAPYEDASQGLFLVQPGKGKTHETQINLQAA
jgi:hypothetical protein